MNFQHTTLLRHRLGISRFGGSEIQRYVLPLEFEVGGLAVVITGKEAAFFER